MARRNIELDSPQLIGFYAKSPDKRVLDAIAAFKAARRHSDAPLLLFDGVKTTQV